VTDVSGARMSARYVAGAELATRGRVSSSVQRRANQEIVPIPGFRWLKRLGFVKRQMIAQAEKQFAAQNWK